LPAFSFLFIYSCRLRGSSLRYPAWNASRGPLWPKPTLTLGPPRGMLERLKIHAGLA
jgi:hypothetical protein